MTDSPTLDPDIDRLVKHTLDPDIDRLVKQACMWMVAAAGMAVCMGMTTPAYVASLSHGTRLVTGYAPEPERRDTAHRAYCDGLRTPARGVTADLRKLAHGGEL